MPNRFFQPGPFVGGGPFIGGGFVPVYPFGPSFYGGGGFITGGFYNPYYVMPQSSIFNQAPLPDVVSTGPPPRFVELSGEAKATLTITLPQPASVWLDGEEIEGKPAKEWVLTTPVLRQGEERVLNVVARWEVGGKKYESEHKVTVRAGDKSKLGVLAGTPVK
jgi:uncharacterized protein (TIGR03000 family)